MYSKFIKRTTAGVLFPLLFYTRSYLLSKPFYSGLGSILMFHRVCPNSPKRRIRSNSGLEVTPEYLESTINFLRQNDYEIVSLSRAAQILNTGDNVKKSLSYLLSTTVMLIITHTLILFLKSMRSLLLFM